jgi:hypothetical protein
MEGKRDISAAAITARTPDGDADGDAAAAGGVRGSSTLTIFYRARSARYQTILAAVAALLSAGLTAAATWALLDPGSRAWRVALLLMAPLSWWMVARLLRAARARKAAVAARRPALRADPAGLTFLDWQGESRQLGWGAIRGFRIVEIAHEGRHLYVDGSYPHAGIQPIRFALADLDADGADLVDTLERLRVDAGVAAA